MIAGAVTALRINYVYPPAKVTIHNETCRSSLRYIGAPNPCVYRSEVVPFTRSAVVALRLPSHTRLHSCLSLRLPFATAAEQEIADRQRAYRKAHKQKIADRQRASAS